MMRWEGGDEEDRIRYKNKNYMNEGRARLSEG